MVGVEDGARADLHERFRLLRLEAVGRHGPEAHARRRRAECANGGEHCRGRGVTAAMMHCYETDFINCLACATYFCEIRVAPRPNSLWLAGLGGPGELREGGKGGQEGLLVLDGSNRGGDSLRSHTGPAARSCNLSMSEKD